MGTTGIPPLHPAPATFNGIVQYAHGFAFLQLGGGQTALLESDNPFTGMVDFTRLAQTANVLAGRFPPGSPGSFTGIMMQQMVNGQALNVLHI